MSNLYLIPVAKAIMTIAIGGSIAGTIGGIGLLKGSEKMHQVSQICADKEKQGHADKNKSLAFKISKWAAWTFAALVGTTGAIALGFGIYFGSGIALFGGAYALGATAVSGKTLWSLAAAFGIAGFAVSQVTVLVKAFHQANSNIRLKR